MLKEVNGDTMQQTDSVQHIYMVVKYVMYAFFRAKICNVQVVGVKGGIGSCSVGKKTVHSRNLPLLKIS
jgi:hypothetical protein